jgi:superfamily II DNA or RNA helicase
VPGDRVSARGEQWSVARTDAFPGCALITLDGAEPVNAGRRFTLIAPFDRIAKIVPKRARMRKRTATLRAALAAVVSARPARGLWTAAAARIDVLSYQLEPALAVLGGATRVLLADAVGLGKTIQAGLILSELHARGLVDRTLILAPAGLRETWAGELRDRFDLRPTVLDQRAIAAAVTGLPAGFNPWASRGIVIASIDLVRRPEVLAAVEEAPFDLVIADEAHHLSPGSDRGAAVERLAARAPWVVLASATPHSGDEAAFDYLTRLGSAGDPLTVFRRTRRDVGIGSGRRVHLHAVALTRAESRLLEDADAYARAIWNGRGRHDRGARLLAITLARRAASSAAALELTLTRRRHLLAGHDDPLPSQPALPWEDADDGDGDSPAEILGVAGLDDAAEDRRRLEALIASAAEARRAPSKIGWIDRWLRRVREPAVIFTEYRDTLEALAAVLERDRRLGVLHGGLATALRHETVRAFNHGALDVLIATDTAGEGLNLHHRCRLVVDVELPWNPLRLEQRVGRVDRLGQARCVHAVRLFHRGTIEDTVLARLERRHLLATATLDDVAAAALGRSDLNPRSLPPLLSAVVTDAASEADRLARQRAHGRGVAPGRAAWCRPRRRTGGPRLWALLYRFQGLGNGGRLAGEACGAMLAGAAGSPLDWLDDPALRAAIEREEIRQSMDVESQLEPLRLAVQRRVQAIADRIRREPARELQTSLFDRRAERVAVFRKLVHDRLDAACRRRLDSLAPPPDRATRAALIAAWPVEK